MALGPLPRRWRPYRFGWMIRFNEAVNIIMAVSRQEL